MREALKEARRALQSKEVPIGAILVYQGKILARSHNQVELLRDATAHAEMLAITSSASHLHNFRLSDATLYSTLEPCLMCAGAILLSRLGRLVYGAKDIRMGAHQSLMNVFDHAKKIHSIEIEGGILEDECAKLLKDFFKERRLETQEYCLDF